MWKNVVCCKFIEFRKRSDRQKRCKWQLLDNWVWNQQRLVTFLWTLAVALWTNGKMKMMVKMVKKNLSIYIQNGWNFFRFNQKNWYNMIICSIFSLFYPSLWLNQCRFTWTFVTWCMWRWWHGPGSEPREWFRSRRYRWSGWYVVTYTRNSTTGKCIGISCTRSFKSSSFTQ